MKCGIIDMGSNTVRLSAYRFGGGVPQRLFSRQKTVGLAGYRVGGALSEDGIRAACRALEEDRALLDGLDIHDLHVFATASLRNVSNGPAAAEAIQVATGIAVDILSGAEEARLSFLGTLQASGADEGILADIGGGSTELLRFQGRAVQSSASLPLGSLSLFQTEVSNLFPTAAERRRLRALALEAVSQVRGAGPTTPLLLGAGGTIQSAAVLVGGLFGRGPDNGHFSAPEAAELLRSLQGGEREALLRILSAVPERVHTILPGLILLDAVLQVYGVEEVQLSTTDIRDGYLVDRVPGWDTPAV